MSKCTKKYLLFLSFLTGVGVIAGGSNITHALTYQDTVDVQFTFNPTVSINVSGDLIIPNLTPGSALDSNIITVRAGSNDANGYTLYSTVGSSTTNYTDLRIDSSNTTNVFTNLSSSKASLENFDDNTWGYSYCNTTNDCDTNTNWVSGNAGSTVAGYNGLPLYNASNNATGVILANTTSHSETELKFKIGAKAASTQAAGAYTNTINFIGVAKVITTTYTLSYVDNSGEATNMPASATTGATTTGAFNITDTAPTRANYIFKGWCTATTNDDTCSGNIIKPGGLYVIGNNPTTFNGSVYAMWRSAIPEVTIADATYMQDVTSCPDTLVTGQTYTIKDSRDNQSYTVAKLADDKCWMTTNLNLAGGTVLSSDKSDVPSANYYTLPASSTSGFSDDATAYVYNSGNTTSTCTGSGCYSYYSWLAATAGGKNSSGSSVTTNGYNAAYSICPKGWRLPTSTTSNANAQSSNNWKTGDWYVLATAYGANLESNHYNNSDTNFYNNAGPGATPNFLLAGGYSRGSFYYGGSYGSYWSSTANSSTNAYYLGFDSGSVYSANYNYRMCGFSVRCVYGE